MTRRAAVFVVALVAAALVGVGLLVIPGSPLEERPTLGLDLQGGLEVTLQAVPPRDRELTEEDLDRSVEIMRDRVDRLGVAEPEIRTQGDDQISIQLPGVKDPAAAAAIIGKTAQLELFDLEKNLVSPSIDARSRQPIATAKLYDLLAGQQALAARGEPDTYYVFRQKGKKLVVGPKATRGEALSKWDGQLPKGHKLFAVPPETVVVECGPGEVVCPGVAELEPTKNSYYLLRFTPPDVPEMTGDDLDLEGTRQDFDTTTGEPIVLMDFTDDGADTFEEITRDVAQRGRLLFNTVGGGQGDYRNYLQHFAIVLDREIKSWPTIDFEEYPGGISGSNGAQISGLADVGEAKDLALVLQTGALPVEFRTLDQTAISATLGKDSLEEAKIAAVVGLLAVAVFLLVFYRFLGVVAVIGLFVYAAILYAAILLFNVTLTLPGIAGLVLTLGVAADANIVIFERIKEEVRAGRSIRAAIQTGYTKGFATIVDANVVTMITAMVLFAVATASVRGFALMLLVGTAISMLTAVVATRALLAVLAGLKVLDSPRVMGASGGGIPRWLKADYIGRRNTWFAISGAVLLLSVGAIAIKGLNLGIDFRGGTQISFTTPQPVRARGRTHRGRQDRTGERADPGPRGGQRSGQRRVPRVRDHHGGALDDRGRLAPVQPRHRSRRRVGRGEERLGELRLADRARRDPRDHRLAPPHRPLHLGALPVEVRRAGARGARPRRPDHRRHLRPPRPGGDDRDGRRDPDRARLLDLRHDHHLRPDPREHPADEARVVPRDRQRLALGDDSPLARDDVHHPGARSRRSGSSAATRSRTSPSRSSSGSAPAPTRRSSSGRRSSRCSRSASPSTRGAATTRARSTCRSEARCSARASPSPFLRRPSRSRRPLPSFPRTRHSRLRKLHGANGAASGEAADLTVAHAEPRRPTSVGNQPYVGAP